MKLDKDLVREILLAVEASDGDPQSPVDVDLLGRSPQDTSYHVMLLDEAGFLEAMDLSSKGNLDWRPQRLTYQGHEFLATIRDGEVWRRTKAGAEKVGGASLGFVWEMAKAFGKQVISERLGITIE